MKIRDAAAGEEKSTPHQERAIPEMQVITKGWWTLKKERQPVEKLEEIDRNQRKQA